MSALMPCDDGIPARKDRHAALRPGATELAPPPAAFTNGSVPLHTCTFASAMCLLRVHVPRGRLLVCAHRRVHLATGSRGAEQY